MSVKGIQWESMCVSMVFQGCFQGVSRKFQGCFKEVSRVFLRSFMEVSRVFKGLFKDFFSKFQAKGFNGTQCVFQ